MHRSFQTDAARASVRQHINLLTAADTLFIVTAFSVQ